MTRSRPTGRWGRWQLVALVGVIALVLAACTGDDGGGDGGQASDGETTGGQAQGGGSSAGQFCEGTNIVFFPGGTEGGGFETVVYNGAKAAEAAFGADRELRVVGLGLRRTMITQFGEAVATSPDGIAIMGHPGDDAFDPLIDDAVEPGHHRHRHEHRAPEAEAKHAAEGTGYVGAVLHDAGCALAKEAIARGGLQSGDQVVRVGPGAQPGRGERTQGILDALEEAGLTVVYLEIDDATNARPAAGVPTFTGMAVGQSRPEGRLHRPRQPDLDDPDLHGGRRPRRPTTSTWPGSTCRPRPCRVSRTGSSTSSSTSSSGCRASWRSSSSA